MRRAGAVLPFKGVLCAVVVLVPMILIRYDTTCLTMFCGAVELQLMYYAQVLIPRLYASAA